MDDNTKQNSLEEYPTRKLNLTVPPLSTRRRLVDKMYAPSTTITDMVPFSWERIPGEPKHNHSLHEQLMPPRKRPPGYCCGDDDCISGSISDTGGDQEHQSERFSDAIDIFSLAESTDDMEQEGCGEGNRSSRSRSRSRSSALFIEGANTNEFNRYPSPNFMIQRFLPDAQALAEESVINKETTRLPLSSSRNVTCHDQQLPKLGCGLGNFFPWRMKPKTCSIRSPVCDTVIGPGPPNHKQNHG